MKFEISNIESGHSLGVYEGANEIEALRAAEQDAGYPADADGYEHLGGNRYLSIPSDPDRSRAELCVVAVEELDTEIEREIGYEEAGESTDADILVEYCKQGVIDNNKINGAKFSDWQDGDHVASTYLDHNPKIAGDTYQEIVGRLDRWLAAKQVSGE